MGDSTLAARVAAAQELAAKATPGPWGTAGDTMTGGMDFRYVTVPIAPSASVSSGILARTQRFGSHAAEAVANADLMAAAPDLVTLAVELLAEVERLTLAARRVSDAWDAVASTDSFDADREHDAAHEAMATVLGKELHHAPD